MIRFLHIVFFLMACCGLSAQCCVEEEIEINDFQTTTVDIPVNGLVNGNLADVNQGVCRVSLEFMHDWVGDVIVELMSPAGETVVLVGPGGGVNSGLNNFTVWDIDFVPCSETAMPDEGFDSDWDSEQPWGILSLYEGSYYPFLSCLENLDVGPVNGTWQLSITDTDLFNQGVLLRVRIEFCDPEGLDCEVCDDCNADGGRIAEDSIDFCASALPDSYMVEFSELPSYDSSIYQTIYYITEADTIIDTSYSRELDIDYPVGDYSICALNYRISDSAAIPGVGDSLDVEDLIDFLENDTTAYCAEMSPECVSISIVRPPQATVDTVFLCEEDTLIVADSILTEAGDYSLILPGDVCDTMLELTVVELDLVPAFMVDLYDTCRGSLIATAENDWDSLEWSLDGQSIGDSTEIIVQEAGELCLTVYRETCFETVCDFLEVGHEIVFDLRSTGAFCPGDSSLVWIEGEIEQVIWSTGEQEDSIYVSQAQMIEILVTDSLGCTARDSISIQAYEAQTVDIIGADTICSNDSTVLGFDTTLFYDPLWLPDSIMSEELTVSSAQRLILQVIDSNACQVSDSIEIIAVDLPSVQLRSALSICSNAESDNDLNLEDSFISGDTIGEWIDLDASGASGILPVLNFEDVAPGSYRFLFRTNVAEEPCEDVEDVVRVEVFDCSCPRLRFLEDTLTYCPEVSDTLELTPYLISDSSGVFAIVDSPDGSQSVIVDSLFVLEAAVPGNYVIEFQAMDVPPSCIERDTLVIQVGEITEIALEQDLITFCEGQDSLLILNGLLLETDDLIWTFQGEIGDLNGAFTLPDRLSIALLPEGRYEFTTSRMGDGICAAAMVSLTVEINETPDIQTPLDTSVSCQEQILQISSEVSTGSVRWTSEGGMILSDSSALSIDIMGPGEYIITATDSVSCTSVDTVTVRLDENGPEFTVVSSPAVCPDEMDGFILIDSITGGHEPYRILLDGEVVLRDSVVGLTSGEYVISVEDAVGCASTATVRIDQGEVFPFSLMADSPILPGDSLKIVAEFEEEPIEADLFWYEEDIVIQDQVQEICVTPSQATIYVLEVISRAGCKTQGSIFIELIDLGQVYRPNVFSPNTDGINDRWKVYGVEGAWVVEELHIFNRWGSKVWEERDIPLELMEGWDGQWKGRDLNPGVYLYNLVLRNTAGEVMQLSGDITLIR